MSASFHLEPNPTKNETHFSSKIFTDFKDTFENISEGAKKQGNPRNKEQNSHWKRARSSEDEKQKHNRLFSNEKLGNILKSFITKEKNKQMKETDLDDKNFQAWKTESDQFPKRHDVLNKLGKMPNGFHRVLLPSILTRKDQALLNESREQYKDMGFLQRKMMSKKTGERIEQREWDTRPKIVMPRSIYDFKGQKEQENEKTNNILRNENPVLMKSKEKEAKIRDKGPNENEESETALRQSQRQSLNDSMQKDKEEIEKSQKQKKIKFSTLTAFPKTQNFLQNDYVNEKHAKLQKLWEYETQETFFKNQKTSQVFSQAKKQMLSTHKNQSKISSLSTFEQNSTKPRNTSIDNSSLKSSETFQITQQNGLKNTKTNFRKKETKPNLLTAFSIFRQENGPSRTWPLKSLLENNEHEDLSQGTRSQKEIAKARILKRKIHSKNKRIKITLKVRFAL